jgi:hypothetical protein
MGESALLFTALLSCTAGMAWLALSMKPHWQQVRGQQFLAPSAQRTLRLLGATAVSVSLLLCMSADHPSMAVLVWVLLATASALAVTFVFTWRPRLLYPLIAWVPVFRS